MTIFHSDESQFKREWRHPRSRDAKRSFLEDFLDPLPKLPRYYYHRKSANNLYLEPMFKQTNFTLDHENRKHLHTKFVLYEVCNIRLRLPISFYFFCYSIDSFSFRFLSGSTHLSVEFRRISGNHSSIILFA